MTRLPHAEPEHLRADRMLHALAQLDRLAPSPAVDRAVLRGARRQVCEVLPHEARAADDEAAGGAATGATRSRAPLLRRRWRMRAAIGLPAALAATLALLIAMPSARTPRGTRIDVGGATARHALRREAPPRAATLPRERELAGESAPSLVETSEVVLPITTVRRRARALPRREQPAPLVGAASPAEWMGRVERLRARERTSPAGPASR